MTHIESTLPEIVGGEVQRLLVSDADGLAAAALYDLVRKATGCRLPQTDSTPSSEVEEMLALCSAVLRRHWQAPLTMLDGLSLQELVSRLMADRVEGNASLGIPAVNGSVTEALSALLERKITGAPEVADGMSLVRLFCDSAVSLDTLTTLTDPTTGWTMDKAMPWATFANLIRADLGCKEITVQMSTTATDRTIDFYFPLCNSVTVDGHFYVGNGRNSLSPNVSLHFDALEQTNFSSNSRPCASVGKLYFPVYKRGSWRVAGSADWGNSTTSYIYIGCKGEKTDTIRFWAFDSGQDQATALTDVEIGQGTCQNLTLNGLKHLTEENIYNHILCRLKQDEAMCGEGVTITLESVNLDKLTSAESVALLAELRDTYGYTFA